MIAQPLKRQGFTVMEIMIALGIFTALTSLAASFFVQGYKVNSFASRLDAQVKSGRDGIEVMSREIREAIDSDRGDYLVEDVQNDAFTFYSNIDSDGSAEKVRYFVDNLILKKGVIDATGSPPQYLEANEIITTIAQYINNGGNPIFTYYDSNGSLLSSFPSEEDEIRLIHVFLNIDIDPGEIPVKYELETSIQIRNLKDNL